MADIELEIVEDSEDVELEIVEAKLKPEQSKRVIPGYSEQTVLPDPGMTLGSVTVEAIPEPHSVVLQRINLADEQPHSVVLDPTAFDLTGYGVISLEIDQVSTSESDWLYFRDSVVSAYLRDKRQTFAATLVIFVNIGTWRSTLTDGQYNRYPPEGMAERIGPISVYPYAADTRFISGEIRLVARG